MKIKLRQNSSINSKEEEKKEQVSENNVSARIVHLPSWQVVGQVLSNVNLHMGASSIQGIV